MWDYSASGWDLLTDTPGTVSVAIEVNTGEPFECARCGTDVATGDYHPEIGCDY